MSVHTYAVEASLALAFLFFVVLPLLVLLLTSVGLIRSRGEAAARGRRSTALMGTFALGSVCLVLLLAAGVVFVHPTVNAEPAPAPPTVGGLQYAVNNAWILDPGASMDADIARGLPGAARHLRPGRLLYAVFVGVTNRTAMRQRTATRLELVDAVGRRYTPLPLGAANRYAYRPATLGPRSALPAAASPAGTDQSAEGLLLVFSISRESYDGGALQLQVHDPGDPSAVGSAQVL